MPGLIFFNRHRAKSVVVDELSDVATRSLGDSKMQLQAQQVSMQTLQVTSIAA